MNPETHKLKHEIYRQLVAKGANYQFAALASVALAKQQLENYEPTPQEKRHIAQCQEEIK
ncbi:hypothetical protein NDI37_26810 [Funiculus sociatus GB2-A5]|uniref:Uncharacterized protein n=1 Tax=Funiculus sociatus GB2-A5 TaxID=2933946 RepID=A0ABV0JX73_9CYAN|nr:MULTISPECIES: hypothetical protein [unclassified Trichocoleus]MBD1907883.1 hypothetical protein [Trichocoleus sp. FACHB-832]MBD2064192.1 hypothetical protein [Trichocoleus sp. FACHB-6]